MGERAPAKKRPAAKPVRRAKEKPSGGHSQAGLIFFLSAVAVVSFCAGYKLGSPSHPKPAPAHHHVTALRKPVGRETLASHVFTSHQAPVGTPSATGSAAPPPRPSPDPTPAQTPRPSETPAPAPSASAAPEATPTPAPKVVGRVAIIIDDFGNNYDEAEGFIRAKVPLALSVLPQLPYTTRIAEEGPQYGKTIMLHLPMEPVSSKNPGPGTVRTEMTDDQINQLVATNMASVPNIEGVNNHEGSKATQDPRVMHLVLEKLHERHLFWVDSMTAVASAGPEEARRMGVPFTIRNVFLDNDDDDDRIHAQLRLLIADARTHGTAVGIGHVRIRTLRCILDMAPTFEAEGIKLVSIKDLVKAQ